MSVDCEVALLLHKLQDKKQVAVAEENFQLENKIKDCVETLQKVGEKLGKLEMEKQWAVDAENYHKAQKIKDEIDQLRVQAYLQCQVTDLLDFPPLQESKQDGIIVSGEAGRNRLMTSSKFLPPLVSSVTRQCPSSSKENIVFPVIHQRSGKVVSRGMNGLHSAPAEMCGSIYLDSSSALALLACSSLTLGSSVQWDKSEMSLAIAVFGLPLVEKLCSKTFVNRESALRGMLRYLNSYTDRKAAFPYEVLHASVLLVCRALQDRVFSVFALSLELAGFLLDNFIYQHRFSEDEMRDATKSLVGEMLSRVGDSNPRIQRAAADALLQLIDTLDAVRNGVVVGALSAPFSGSTEEREAEGRCHLVLKLLQRFDVHASSKWLDASELIRFGLKALEHESQSVRELGERVVLGLYVQVGDSIVRLLPAFDDDNFKHLWQEIEHLDDQEMGGGGRPSSVVATNGEDSENECVFCRRKSPQIEGLNNHYWRDCPMLTECSQCKLVVEISELREHLLGECTFRSRYRRCPTCLDAVANKSYDKHLRAKSCQAPKPDYLGSRCPLCHLDIPPWEDGWRLHLATQPGCPLNPRGSNYKRPSHISKLLFFRNK